MSLPICRLDQWRGGRGKTAKKSGCDQSTTLSFTMTLHKPADGVTETTSMYNISVNVWTHLALQPYLSYWLTALWSISFSYICIIHPAVGVSVWRMNHDTSSNCYYSWSCESSGDFFTHKTHTSLRQSLQILTEKLNMCGGLESERCGVLLNGEWWCYLVAHGVCYCTLCCWCCSLETGCCLQVSPHLLCRRTVSCLHGIKHTHRSTRGTCLWKSILLLLPNKSWSNMYDHSNNFTYQVQLMLHSFNSGGVNSRFPQVLYWSTHLNYFQLTFYFTMYLTALVTLQIKSL